MTRKYITPDGIKDENGHYMRPLPPKPEQEATGPAGDISIDDLLEKGLYMLHLLMKSIQTQISTHTYDRDTIMNLKDTMSMLHELKKREKELLDKLSEAELADLVKEAQDARKLPSGG